MAPGKRIPEFWYSNTYNNIKVYIALNVGQIGVLQTLHMLIHFILSTTQKSMRYF